VSASPSTKSNNTGDLKGDRRRERDQEKVFTKREKKIKTLEVEMKGRRRQRELDFYLKRGFQKIKNQSS
jgi:hypothetical protein